MKTATLTYPVHDARSTTLNLIARYLPHIIIVTLLFGILALATYGAPVYHVTHPVFPLGQHF